jgi:hypothetical protein
MKIRSSHYRLPRRETIEQPPDPAKIAREQRMKELSERKAQLYEKIAALEAKLGYDTDFLVYLPRAAAGPAPDFMQRACAYLESFRARVEAAGAKVWLSKDHDCQTRVFEISKFREIDGQVLCSGKWTSEKYRDLFRGVSVDMITFAGDPDLMTEIHRPADCMTIDETAAHVQAAAKSDAILGCAGAACLSFDPAWGPTEIYRLKG